MRIGKLVEVDCSMSAGLMSHDLFAASEFHGRAAGSARRVSILGRALAM